MPMGRARRTKCGIAEIHRSIARSDAVVAGADSLDQLAVHPAFDGQYPNLRWILVHLIEELGQVDAGRGGTKLLTQRLSFDQRGLEVGPGQGLTSHAIAERAQDLGKLRAVWARNQLGT